MSFNQELLCMLYSSKGSLNYTQTVLKDNCRDFQIPDGIWTQVQTFKLLISLIIFWRIFSCKSIKPASKSRQLDLAKAADPVLATKSTLKEFRTDSQWECIYKYALDVSNLLSIRVDLPRPCHCKQLSKRLESGVLLESNGVRVVVSPSLSEQLKVTLFLPVLDAMLSELEQWFSDKNLMHMRAIQARAPGSPHYQSYCSSC